MVQIITPPHEYTKQGKSVFLAGSIEMGAAVSWQQDIIDELSGTNCTILNPRRAAWDSSWTQEESNPVFNEQVAWELDGILKNADLVCFYFDPNTKSPVTLLELGLVLASGKECLVCCPLGYWRKGNVDITCRRYGVEVIDSLPTLISKLTAKLNGL